jgi:guanidinoacetate N-methyltransferase
MDTIIEKSLKTLNLCETQIMIYLKILKSSKLSLSELCSLTEKENQDIKKLCLNLISLGLIGKTNDNLNYFANSPGVIVDLIKNNNLTKNNSDIANELENAIKMMNSYIYPGDNPNFLVRNTIDRKNKFIPNLRGKWSNADIDYEITKEGEKILKIFNLEVMSDFETPYMESLADITTSKGGKVLNIGFGLGIIDNFIEENRKKDNISEHHIIELNHKIYEKALSWRKSQKKKDKIFIHKGDWQDILPNLKKNGLIFDGVVYDGFPLEINEMCRDCVPFLDELFKLKIVKNTGIVTFYMDSTEGFSDKFKEYLRSLGVRKLEAKKISVSLPKRNCEYWHTPYFLAPILSDFKY